MPVPGFGFHAIHLHEIKLSTIGFELSAQKPNHNFFSKRKADG
jgi:hypothetical protein